MKVKDVKRQGIPAVTRVPGKNTVMVAVQLRSNVVKGKEIVILTLNVMVA